MDFENVDKIMPAPNQAQPNDPMSDIQAAQQGQPIKAFPGQDHKSHIAIKQAFMTDPSTGGNPMMQKVSAQLQANVQEHMVMEFTEQVQAQMQLSAQQQGQQSNQDPNAQGQAMAEAAKQVAVMNQQNLQNQLSSQEQGGPKDQAAMMTAQAKMADTHIKATKTQHDMKFKDQEIELKKAKLGLDHLKTMHNSDDKNKDRQAKMDQIVTTKGIDALIQGQSHAFTAKQNLRENIQQAQMERANNAHQHELQKDQMSHQAALQPTPTAPKGE
jgi:hypothetical protein